MSAVAVRATRARLGTRVATSRAESTIISPATQNTTVGWPVSPAAIPPIAGPIISPPIWAAP